MIQIPVHKGMTVLKRELFKSTITVGALLINVQFLKEAKQLRPHLLQIPRLPSIIPTKTTQKLLLLSPEIDYLNLDSLPSNLQEFIKRTNAEMKSHTIEVDYDYWTAEQILSSILPSEFVIPGSFATVGHIAHFNLKPEYDQYKHLIGQVILDVPSS